MDFLNRLLFSFLGSGAIFYIVVKVSLSYWKKRGILHEKPKFFYGNLKGFLKKKHVTEILSDLYQKYKKKAPFIGFFAFLKPMLLILDLDLVQKILSMDAAFFMERGLYHNTEDDILSENLMQLDGKSWSDLHQKVKPCFAEDKIKLLLPAVEKVANNLMKSVEQLHRIEDTFDIKNLVESYNIDVISFLVFGEEHNSLNSSTNEMLSVSSALWKNLTYKKSYFTWDFPNLAKIFQFQLYDERTSSYFTSLVSNKLKECEWNRSKAYQYNFLKLFTELRQQKARENRLNTNEISAQCFSFLLAGLKPSNITMTYCLYELALRPALQTQVRAELHHVLEKHNAMVNQETLDDLVLLKQVLYETLRMHSPYPILVRKVSEDYEVPNSTFMLKKGNHLLLPIAAIHNDPEIYENPDFFLPERFTPENIKKRHPMSWLPFGAGARGCLAQKYVEQQMLIGLMKLLSKYEFSPDDQTEKSKDTLVKYDTKHILTMSKKDIKLKLKPVQ